MKKKTLMMQSTDSHQYNLVTSYAILYLIVLNAFHLKKRWKMTEKCLSIPPWN